MTLEEMRGSNKNFLSPLDVATVLHCAPYSINVQAREDITRFPFPAFMINSRVKIPRVPFVEWADTMGLR